MMELSLVETEELFSILAGRDGLVSYDEFMKGVKLIRGPARSQDVVALKRIGEHLEREFQALRQAVVQLSCSICGSMDDSATNTPTFLPSSEGQAYRL